MIQRWSHDYRFTLWQDTVSGEWVTYKDHLAALADKDNLIAECKVDIATYRRRLIDMEGSRDHWKSECEKKDKEIERLSARDCNATIQLVWPREDDPWNKISLKIVDVGVSDNIYVVECQEIVKKDQEISLWKQSYRAVDKDNIELREEIVALKRASHDPDCDSLDTIVAGKPCNCYLKYKAENIRLKEDLAQQTDLTREAETEAAKLRNALGVVQANYDIYTTALVKFVVDEALIRSEAEKSLLEGRCENASNS